MLHDIEQEDTIVGLIGQRRQDLHGIAADRQIEHPVGMHGGIGEEFDAGHVAYLALLERGADQSCAAADVEHASRFLWHQQEHVGARLRVI